jgi:hypothetical protein
MKTRAREYLLELFGALLLGVTLALLMPQARAGLVATDEAVSASESQQERERVIALVERPEIASQLQKMGIAPQEAKARVEAMNDAEVRTLAGKLGVLPAGGAVSNTDLLLIIIVILLVVLIL